MFLVLTGVALMLGFTQNQFNWILLAVPLFAFLLTVFAVLKAKQPLPDKHFPLLKEQLEADIVALRVAA